MAKTTILLLAVIFSSSMHDSCALHSTIFLSANRSTTWINNHSQPPIFSFSDGPSAYPVLIHGSVDAMSFLYSDEIHTGCGFFCNPGTTDSCYFAVFIARMYMGPDADSYQIIWSANRDNPVGENATLEFSQDGNLVLSDAHGKHVWSTGTSSKGVTGMRITETGNLMLLNGMNTSIWQSFDHPTDTLLTGQVLEEGQVLTSRISSTILSRGMFSLSVSSSTWSAFVQMNASTIYLHLRPSVYGNLTFPLKYVGFREENVTFSYAMVGGDLKLALVVPKLSRIQLLRLDRDGGVRIYGWARSRGWVAVFVLLGGWDECQLPLKCGKYGVCKQGQCACPKGINGVDYFHHVNDQLPNLGCDHIVPPSSQNYQYQLEEFGNLSFFAYADPRAAVPGFQSLEECKHACSQNSSCKAAFFKFENNASEGHCYLVSEVLTIRGDPVSIRSYNSTAFIKVRVPLPSTHRHPGGLTRSGFFSVTTMFLSTIVCFLLLWVKKYRNCEGKDHWGKVPEMPRKFKYKDLRVATGKFSEKLGEGGFGAVFKGVLRDGTKIAVKRLDNAGQGMKEFLAEVKTLGNIDHVNLVKLIGFCAKKSHKLLVHEYMSNGSLDNWIFNEKKSSNLDWKMRKKILVDVAKGLAYLHEECRQRIAHLDVKPHNILLDDSFSAKLSDFGMSKLIDRGDSQVITSFRGTLGYLAPEWGCSCITVKADIYSFGVVLAELVCGRKNLDLSGPELDMQLLCLLRKKALEKRLIDIVDRRSDDMVLHGEEVATVMRIGLWCLDDDQTRRPLMSTVVKVLEGVTEFDSSISDNSSKNT